MEFEQSVFINCPFDKKYKDNLLRPVLYALLRNGLSPRLSLENADGGELRIQKITTLMKACKYSIHDLSLVKAKQAEDFARMNMPFELGIDYGLRNSGMKRYAQKQFLILEANEYDYVKALSDLKGFDVQVHGNKMVHMFECIYNWSSATLKISKQPPPLKTYYDFIDFNSSLFEEKVAEYGSDMLAKNYIDHIPIPEYIEEIKERL